MLSQALIDFAECFLQPVFSQVPESHTHALLSVAVFNKHPQSDRERELFSLKGKDKQRYRIGSDHHCTCVTPTKTVFVVLSDFSSFTYPPLRHGWDFCSYSQISGFQFSESSKNSVEMHFECDFSPFRIQTLTQSYPC